MYSNQKRRQAIAVYYKDVNDVQVAWIIPALKAFAYFVGVCIAAWGVTKGVDAAYEWMVEKFSSKKGGSDDKYRNLVDSLWNQQPASASTDTVDLSNGTPEWVAKAVSDGVVDTEEEAFALTVNTLRDYLGSRQDNISRELAQFGSLYTALPRWYREVCWESKTWLDFCDRLITVGRNSSGIFYSSNNQYSRYAISDLDAICDILTVGQQCVDRQTGIFSLANMNEYIDRSLVNAISDATNGSFYDEGMVLGAIVLMLNLAERRTL